MVERTDPQAMESPTASSPAEPQLLQLRQGEREDDPTAGAGITLLSAPEGEAADRLAETRERVRSLNERLKVLASNKRGQCASSREVGVEDAGTASGAQPGGADLRRAEPPPELRA